MPQNNLGLTKLQCRYGVLAISGKQFKPSLNEGLTGLMFRYILDDASCMGLYEKPKEAQTKSSEVSSPEREQNNYDLRFIKKPKKKEHSDQINSNSNSDEEKNNSRCAIM